MKLNIKLFADGAVKKDILHMYKNPNIAGFTTNPTLMNKAGITNYQKFALDILQSVKNKPISFEVFSDDFDDMLRQARLIASWGDNVYVKIPITNTKGEYTVHLLEKLVAESIKVNVTAILHIDQIKQIMPIMKNAPSSYVSVFAGRIADSGYDPLPIMKESLKLISVNENLELIWASPRELYNVVQANEIGCHIITATSDILKKLPTLGKDLFEFSLDTVKMFYNDAKTSGFEL
jgi:transaldolase